MKSARLSGTWYATPNPQLEKMDNTEKTNILLIDDRPENLLALETILKRPGLNLMKALSGNEALGMLLDYDFALVLLDVQMPEMDGFETAELMRGNEETRHIPIIFVTAISKEQKHVFKGYEAGAVDYLFKPLDPDILQGKVNIFLELYQQKRALKEMTRNLEQTVRELETGKGIIEEKNRLLNDLSIRDGLTDLYNHRHMEIVSKQEFIRAVRYQTDLSCLLMDLDYFKKVNDTFGHAFGDVVLKEFSLRVKQNLRSADLAFRYGGEEFMVLLPHTGTNGARQTAEKLRAYCDANPFTDGITSTIVTVSIGLASVKENRPKSAGDLIAYADKALYRAKAEGRNRIVGYLEKPLDLVSQKGIPAGNDIRYLKEQLSAILDKTKTASMASLQLLAKNRGGDLSEKHNQWVRHYIDLIGHKLFLPPSIIETFYRAASMHDSFKSLMLESLIKGKKDLTGEDEDRTRIEDHLYVLGELTELFDFFSDERSILLYHHENFDGSGYPEGLQGEQIPLGARIFALIDAFVTMTSDQSHKEKLTMKKAAVELAENAGKQFDPKLVSTFLNIIQENGLLTHADNQQSTIYNQQSTIINSI